MKIPAFRTAWFISLLATASIATGGKASSRDPDLQQIAGYREWKKLTESPMMVPDSTITG